MNIKILVATHKKYWMPSDEVYLPIHVGREGKEDLGYVGDNTGENISSKNANYCELTGLYWAWKNLDCEYIGLCHYRRYFGKPIKYLDYFREEKEQICTYNDFKELIESNVAIVPKKGKVKDSVGAHYKKDHHWEDMLTVRTIIENRFPDYLYALDFVLQSRETYFCNMFVMPKKMFSDYCAWLFAIFFELENVVDISNYDSYQARIYGFLSERLLTVWLLKNKIKCKELPMVNLERKVKIKRKITRRLIKFMGI